MKKILTLNLLRTMALAAVVVGAAGSVSLVLYMGRNNKSIFLIALFVVWVLSPFMALLVANMVSRHWSVITRVTLYGLMIVLALGSLASYSGAWSPPGTKTAFVFLVVPLLSWLLMAIGIPVAALLSRRQSHKD